MVTALHEAQEALAALARHPDARWRLRPESIETFASLQSRMLEAAAPLVVTGGLLIYSTCTLAPEENEGVIDAVMQEQRGAFCIVPVNVEGLAADTGGVFWMVSERNLAETAPLSHIRCSMP